MALSLRPLGSLCVALLLGACFDPAGGGTDDTTEGSSSTTASNDGPATCVPGQLQPCVCPNGAGNQECNTEGTAFGECICVGSDGTTTTGPAETTTGVSDTTSSADDSTSDSGSTGSAEDSSGTTMGLEDTGLAEESSSEGGFGPLEVGESCNDDSECMTGVCWDFSDYDPFCFGTACSVNCASDVQCVNAMAIAGAPDPSASSCGADGRCSTLGTGFGAYACAGPSESTLSE
ncbi:MAG: hypothetical protein AAF799_16670 [Myxococcota bacterium]